jgi:HPt (histidine-containing phosphotransfer) domain-containing protein
MIPTTTNINTVSETDSEKFYDMCMIERLCHNNEERIKKLVSVFIEQMPQSVEEIKQAYAKRDFAVVRKTAHRIKPTLSYYAIIKIEKDILQIEKMAKGEVDSADMELKIIKLDIVVGEVVKKMKQDYFNN